MFGFLKKKSVPKKEEQFPPVPNWQPEIVQPLEQIVDRIGLYTNNERDFAIFSNGTAVILPDGLSDLDAELFAKNALSKVFNAHPDMNPQNMKDGNLLVTYNHDAANVVLSDVVAANWLEIDKQHQNALATYEVLITPLGHNVFDDFGKKALFGRCYMFMDAQNPVVKCIQRKAG